MFFLFSFVFFFFFFVCECEFVIRLYYDDYNLNNSKIKSNSIHTHTKHSHTKKEGKEENVNFFYLRNTLQMNICDGTKFGHTRIESKWEWITDIEMEKKCSCAKFAYKQFITKKKNICVIVMRMNYFIYFYTSR